MLATVVRHSVENRQRGRVEGVEAVLRHLAALAKETKDPHARDLVERMSASCKAEMERRGWFDVQPVVVRVDATGKELELQIGDRVAEIGLEELSPSSE